MKAKKLIHAALIVAGLAVAQSSLPAAAQTKTPNSGDRIGSWEYKCEAIAKDQTICGLIQRIADKGTKKEVLGVTVRPVSKKENRLAIVITAPLGIFLGTGIAGKVDDGKQFKFNLQQCTRSGCDAAIILNDDLLAQLRKGKRLLVGFKARAGAKTIIIPVDLKGFDEGVGYIFKK